MARSYEELLELSEDKRGGDPAVVSVGIGSLTIGASPAISLPPSGVTLVVGGNNAGKSTLLKQIHAELLASYGAIHHDPPVLTGLALEKSGTLADLYAWLGENSQADAKGFSRSGVHIGTSVLEQVWATGGPIPSGHLWQLGQAVVFLADARGRFNQIQAVPRRPDISAPPSNPLHVFEDDAAAFDELKAYSVDIFGSSLTLDRLSGNTMVRFGVTEVQVPPVDAVTAEYREAIAALRPLANQGDGIASTLGLLIPLVAGRYRIALIDEPEAFLHPPQAFKLGQTLARIAERHKSQLILATHDRNMVAGVLAAQARDTSVVRLERSADVVVGHPLEADRLNDLWSSASLRHSNVLDGLFHRAVVIAENERDCVFYAAALENLGPLPEGLLPSDILFIPSHGIAGATELASVLRAAAVPVIAALDLDALQDETVLRSVVAAVGGQWTDALDANFRAAVAEFNTPRQKRTRADVQALVDSVLEDEPTAVYEGDVKRRITTLLSTENPWREVKDYGMARFKADRSAADASVAILREEGVVLAHVGELERFAPALGVAKGRQWLPAALDAGAHQTADAKAHAQNLVSAILAAELRNVSR